MLLLQLNIFATIVKMTEKKTRILFLLLGLTIGIILGASVVRVYSDKVNAETSVSKNFVSRLFSNIIGLVYKPKHTKTDTVLIDNTVKNAQGQNIVIGDTSSFIANRDAESNKNNDSIADIKSDKNDGAAQESTDKLLGTRRIEVIEKKVKLSKKDSLAAVKSGAKRINEPAVIAVEFWLSQINNRGYKMEKNKVILFGVNKDEPLKLFRIEDRLFLKLQNQFSSINNRNDFHSFEKVNDASIIAQLNSLAESK